MPVDAPGLGVPWNWSTVAELSHWVLLASPLQMDRQKERKKDFLRADPLKRLYFFKTKHLKHLNRTLNRDFGAEV